jgi:hypothetical protein
MPVRPSYLPANAEFKVFVVKGRWQVEINQNKVEEPGPSSLL